MRLKLLKLGAVLLLGLSLNVLHAQNMYIKKTTGTQTTYLLSNIKKISFSSGNIIVSKIVGISDTYQLSSLQYLNFTDLSTGISFFDKSKGLVQLYPNPTVDFLNIQLTNLESNNIEIDIYSIDGKLLIKKEINKQSNDYVLNVSMLHEGLYLCTIKNGSSIETKKFYKQ